MYQNMYEGKVRIVPHYMSQLVAINSCNVLIQYSTNPKHTCANNPFEQSFIPSLPVRLQN